MAGIDFSGWKLLYIYICIVNPIKIYALVEVLNPEESSPCKVLQKVMGQTPTLSGLVSHSSQ